MFRSLALNGGHLLVNSVQHFLEENIDDINTPDIDLSFFHLNEDPFKKLTTAYSTTTPVVELLPETEAIAPVVFDDSVSSSASLVSTQPSLDGDNHFIDLSQLICESAEGQQLIISPDDVVMDSFATSELANGSPVYHAMQTLDSSQLTIDRLSASQSPLSYVSPYESSADVLPIMETMDTKEAFDYLQSSPVPTVVNDHLYTRSTTPTTSSIASKSCKVETKEKHVAIRKKNNVASKKSRLTKRDKQKQMEEKIVHYLADNKRCIEEISRMEREIEWCKNYLFQKVRGAAKR